MLSSVPLVVKAVIVVGARVCEQSQVPLFPARQSQDELLPGAETLRVGFFVICGAAFLDSCTRGTGGSDGSLVGALVTTVLSLVDSVGVFAVGAFAIGLVDVEQSQVSPSLASLQSHCESL